MIVDMSNLVAYGVIGFCAIIVIVVARIIYLEQKREEGPRKRLLVSGGIFMGFCGLLAFGTGYVQIYEGDRKAKVKDLKEEIAELETKVKDCDKKIKALETTLAAKNTKINSKDIEIVKLNGKLDRIRAASQSAINIRGGFLASLPPSVPDKTKKALITCITELKKIFKK